MIDIPYPNRLNHTQVNMLRVLNEQIEGSNKEVDYLLTDFTNDQLELIGKFVLSFYNR